jgi:hypothetical protein
MGLKQIKPSLRITFLRHFTNELVNNSAKEEIFKKRIEIGKLKQKFAQPIDSSKKLDKDIAKSPFEGPVFQPSKYRIISKEPFEKSTKRKEIIRRGREPIIHRMKISKRKSLQKLKKLIRVGRKPKKIHPRKLQVKIHPRIHELTFVQPQAQEMPEGFILGKLERLIKDPSIQSIECLGPNKKILVKRYNKLNKTSIILTKQEIVEIIENFSVKAKIPVVGGILKAAVGNLIISAVVSEFVGSRFIINKITPYSMITR